MNDRKLEQLCAKVRWETNNVVKPVGWMKDAIVAAKRKL